MLEKIKNDVRELPEIGISTDTRDILSHAAKQSKQYSDYFMVDIDAHVTETQFAVVAGCTLALGPRHSVY